MPSATATAWSSAVSVALPSSASAIVAAPSSHRLLLPRRSDVSVELVASAVAMPPEMVMCLRGQETADEAIAALAVEKGRLKRFLLMRTAALS